MFPHYFEYVGYVWFIVSIICLILEVGTPGLFFFLSLAAGSAVAACSAFFSYEWTGQVIFMLAGTALSFAVFKQLFANKKASSYKTNANALLKQQAIVVETIAPRTTGRIKVRGEEWPAIADEHVILQKGTSVIIVRIEGNKVIVK